MKYLILCTSFLYFSMANAFESLEVQALMPGMVVLKVDNQRVTLKQGSPAIQGIRLVSSDTVSAQIEINGEVKSYSMGTTVSTDFSQRERIHEQIIADNGGMFRAHGSINGQSVRFLVDTGATSVAMSATDARRLGIQYRLHGERIRTHTASGVANAWSITLDSVRLGQLLEKNVKGVVVEGNYPYNVLLGMTFLSRMKVEKEGRKLVISKKQ